MSVNSRQSVNSVNSLKGELTEVDAFELTKLTEVDAKVDAKVDAINRGNH